MFQSANGTNITDCVAHGSDESHFAIPVNLRRNADPRSSNGGCLSAIEKGHAVSSFFESTLVDSPNMKRYSPKWAKLTPFIFDFCNSADLVRKMLSEQ